MLTIRGKKNMKMTKDESGATFNKLWGRVKVEKTISAVKCLELKIADIFFLLFQKAYNSLKKMFDLKQTVSLNLIYYLITLIRFS